MSQIRTMTMCSKTRIIGIYHGLIKCCSHVVSSGRSNRQPPANKSSKKRERETNRNTMSIRRHKCGDSPTQSAESDLSRTPGSTGDPGGRDMEDEAQGIGDPPSLPGKRKRVGTSNTSSVNGDRRPAQRAPKRQRTRELGGTPLRPTAGSQAVRSAKGKRDPSQ